MLLNNANIIRQNRKTLKIEIDMNGELIIYCPRGLSYEKIEKIINSKEEFLTRKLKKISNINLKYKDIFDKKTLYLLGKKYYIIPTDKVGKTYFTEDSFLMPKKYFENETFNHYIKKTLKKVAENILTKRINEICNDLSEKYKFNKLTIGEYQAKWGSCDNLKSIKLNWKTIMLTPNEIDFIIYHELTHLIELNHSKKFYNNLQNICPNWKIYLKSIKEKSFLLTLYNQKKPI